MKTYAAKAGEIERRWYIVDAQGQTLGRLASRVAHVLIGKHKPMYSPGLDVGDFVIVVNADRIRVTGRKMDEKMYYRHSGYPGGLRAFNLRDYLQRNPAQVFELAVRGMLPRNRLGRKMLKKLKVYAGPDHPHAAQQPQPLEF